MPDQSSVSGAAQVDVHAHRATRYTLYLGMVAAGMATTVLGPMLPLLTVRWTLADDQAGGLVSAQFAGAFIGSVAPSLLSPRAPLTFVAGTGYTVAALGLVAMALVAWPAGMAAAVTWGFGLGLLLPTSNLIAAELAGGRATSAVSLMNFSWSLGAVSWPVIVSRANTPAHVPVLAGGLALALVAFVPQLLRDPIRRHDEPRPTVTDSQVPSGTWLFLTALFYLYGTVENAVGAWIAAFIQRLPDGATALWTWGPACFWGGLAAGRLIFSLAAPPRDRPWMIGSLLLASAGLALLLTTGDQRLALVAGTTVGLGLAMVFPATVTIMTRALGPASRRAAGPMFALAGLGGATMPWLVGVISEQTHSLRLGLLPVLAITLTLLALHTRPTHHPTRPDDHTPQ